MAFTMSDAASRAGKMRREDEDPRIREGEEVDDVRVEAGAHVEDHVVGVERIDGCHQLQLVPGAEVGDLLDEVQRSGHESEVAVLAFRIEARAENRDAAVERLAAPEEVIEIALDGRVDGVADGGGAGVEIDQHRLPVTGEREREVDRESRFPDAAFSRRDGDDPFDGHGCARV
jgi:hypothetical protein